MWCKVKNKSKEDKEQNKERNKEKQKEKNKERKTKREKQKEESKEEKKTKEKQAREMAYCGVWTMLRIKLDTLSTMSILVHRSVAAMATVERRFEQIARRH